MSATDDIEIALNKPAVYLENGIAVYRFSSANSCTKALVAARMGLDGEAPPEAMQRRYDDGHLHEPAILEAVEKQTGWRMTGSSQHRVEIPVMDKVILRGHLDEIAKNPSFDPDRRVVEAKALADSGFKDWLKSGFSKFPYYAAQVTLQMHATDLPLIFAVKNKNSAEVNVTLVDDPPMDINDILLRIKRAEMKGRRDELPGPCDIRQYPCPFYRLHESEDGEDIGGLEEFTSDVEKEDFDALCEEYDRARDLESEGKERKKEAARKLMEQYLEWEDKKAGEKFVVTKKNHTYRWLDEDAMRADGLDPEQYRREKFSQYPFVKRR